MASSLHDAARNGDLVKITAAIGEGANLEQRDAHSRTPLIMAAWAGQTNVVKALIAAGCQAGACAQDDMSALHFAAQKGHVECVRWLINGGANGGAKVNAKSKKGANALMMAAQHGHKEVVELLLQRKADPLAKNRRGETARQMVKGSAEIAAILEAAEEARQAEKQGDQAVEARLEKKKERQNAKSGAQREAAAEAAGAAESDAAEAAPGAGVGAEQKPKKPRIALNYEEEDFEES